MLTVYALIHLFMCASFNNSQLLVQDVILTIHLCVLHKTMRVLLSESPSGYLIAFGGGILYGNHYEHLHTEGRTGQGCFYVLLPHYHTAMIST